MILVTGGAGYIGSHTCLELLEAGHEVLVLDNLSNASPEGLRRVERLTGKKVELVEGDLRDGAALERLFGSRRIEAVLHFAGLKSVGESVEQPLRYYDNNVAGTVKLLEAMGRHGVKRLVFSSSATVYGDPSRVPVTEDMPLSAANPYGRTKLIIEDMCREVFRADPSWRIALLRYFNPVGAHASGEIGEDPQGVPNNLMPFALQVAVGRRPVLNVFGGDWPTADGTGVRDYIHVVDLAKGHVAALAKLDALGGCVPLNLGTGRGVSVLELVAGLSRAVGRPVPHQVVARRAGDVASVFADPTRAAQLLGWRAELGLDAMCADSWRWQSQNPNGYAR
ncbi:MAG: UDP-glucose 4-epimerase GalE [Myxococcaceae bacterium]|nr:UDP-glucose 4-epimerase GalE [Myxococcaceae bacterium]